MIGETISNYRLLGQLGAGGTGTVYRAEDLRLGREVAIKVLSADLAEEPAELERFQREARLASAVNHPHICAIYDVGEHNGRPFIVMELLDGETLRDVLRGQPLPVDRLLALAFHVAEALEAAHRRGVIHRDLKPANVFVATDGRHAKVLDFGLARLLPDHPRTRRASSSWPTASARPDPTTSQSGAGSAPYMSPEQARGDALDPRTDLFSFGAVLYEMATGQRAFPGKTAAAVFDGILNRKPTAPTTLNPEVPADLEQVIGKALEKDRQLRYQTAADLLADLRRVKRRRENPSSTGPLPVPPDSPWSEADRVGSVATRRRAGAAILVLLAIAAVAVGLWRLRRPRPAPLNERDSILLADFVNTTGDPVFDGTLREALAVQLSQSPFLDIVPDDRVGETLQMMTRTPDERLTHALAREVCQRLGAKALLEGSIASLGRTYVLTLDATDCGAGESIAREQAQADSKEHVLRALGRSASSIRARLGESLATMERFDVPIEQATTPSLEALKAYALGVARRAMGSDVEAIPFFKRAVELDPTFASAHSALSSIYGGLGETEQRGIFARLAYTNRDHVSQRERMFIEYQYHDAAGDELRAVGILEVWKQSYPHDYRPANALAVSLNRLGQYARAIEEASEAQRRNPSHPFPYSNLAYAYRGANRFAEARQAAEQAVVRRIETVPTRRLLYQLARLDHNPAEAERHLVWGRGRSREFDLVGAQAQAVAFEGQMSTARALYRRTTDMAQHQGFPHVALGYAAQVVWTEALYGNGRLAVRQAREVLRGDPTAAPRLRAAAALALAGAPDEAERVIAASRDAETSDTFVKMVYVPVAEAAVHLARHQPAQVIEALEDAVAYELGSVAALAPVFLRGQALLQQGDGGAAAKEFRTLLDHRGVDPFSPLYALAGLELARALALTGDTAKSRTAYDEFLAAWADADQDLPILLAARAERMRLR